MIRKVLAAVALTIAMPIAADEDRLIGLWASRTEIPPTYRGTVTITEMENDRREICAYGHCRVGKSFRFELPGIGEVVTEPGGGAHWIQPGAATYNGWATPIRMEKAGARWAGRVEPFVERRTLYLRFLRGEEGELRVFLRHTERNHGVFVDLATATIDGDSVRLLDREGALIDEGRLTDDGERLVVSVGGYGTVLLRRLEEGEPAIGFAPRVGSAPTPRLPSPDRDWPTAAPQEVGLRPQPLADLLTRIATLEIQAVNSAAVHSVLVARNGKLVFEEYFAGHDVDTTHDTRSAGKSITSMLVGAMGVDPELTLCESVAWAKERCEEDPRRKQITVEHLITMTPGIACNDSDDDSPGNEGTMQSQSAQPDWYRYIVDVPMEHEPGAQGFYCTAGINLVGAILSAEGGAETYQLFDRYLAQPLGIRQYQMNLDPLGRGYLGGGLYLRPRDMLKFGEVMRSGGLWKGKRILPKSWVEASSAAHASLNGEDDYGYAWWRQTFDIEGRSIETYYASGNGGQLLFVIPELEMTVLFMGGNYSNYGTWRHFRDTYLTEYILKAALPEEP